MPPGPPLHGRQQPPLTGADTIKTFPLRALPTLCYMARAVQLVPLGYSVGKNGEITDFNQKDSDNKYTTDTRYNSQILNTTDQLIVDIWNPFFLY